MSGHVSQSDNTEKQPSSGQTPVRLSRRHGSALPTTTTTTRVKLRHASSAPVPMAPQQCRQCHQHDDRFYCHPCLNSLIDLHNNEMTRLTLARDKALNTVQHLLGSCHSPSWAQELPDPFESQAQAQPASLLLFQLLQLRAQAAASIDRIQNVHLCIAQSQQTYLKGKEKLKEKRVQILQRKQNLAKAWSSLEGSSSSSTSRASAKTPGWTTDVYTQYEQRADHSATIPDDNHQLGAVMASTRLSVASLQREAKSIASQLKVVRAALAREALSLYAVSPPHSSPESTLPPHRKSEEMSASSYVAQRFSKLSERYMPGAFVFHPDTDTRRRPLPPDVVSVDTSTGTGASQWTISGLSLPLPSEVRRHSRESVNGAIAYTVHLLHLLSGYLGMALPFSLVMQKGKLSVRPDPLWDGGGGSSAKPLQLSSAAYTFLTAVATSTSSKPSKLNHLAESTFGLGASTLSTIESYIQLPSSSSIPWGLASVAVAKPTVEPAESERTHQRSLTDQADTEAGPSSSPSAAPSKIKPDQAAKVFVSGLVMLSYNVAYLASKQGIKVDLVTAASNPLQLLHHMLHQAELGSQSHANYIASCSLDGLSMPQLDYDQLAQVLEPTNSSLENSKKSKRSSSTVKQPASRSASSRTNKILEQSYIDAGAAAASVLNIADPSKLSKPEEHNSTSNSRTDAKARSRPSTDHRGRQVPVSSAPPTTLTFLRQRGQNATKPKETEAGKARQKSHLSEAATSKAGPGAVIFNGVEVGVGNVAPSDPSKRVSSGKTKVKDVEEGWNLV